MNFVLPLFFIVILNFIKFTYSICPDGTLPSLSNAAICFKFIPDKAMFTEAEGICQQQGYGGHLVSITDGFTNTFLAQNANKTFTEIDFWIGGDDLDQRGKWVWLDGQSFTFKNWAPDEPSLLPGYQCISETMASFWFTADCFREKSFICEIPAINVSSGTTTVSGGATTTNGTTVPTEQTATTTLPFSASSATSEPSTPPPSTTEEPQTTTTTLGPPIYTCDSDWHQYNVTHFCFKIFPKNVFDDAENVCVSYKGHLASIHNDDEKQFVEGLMDNTYYWLGLCTTDNGQTWIWTDGTPFDYDDGWCDGSPGKNPNSCAILNPQQNCFTTIRKNTAGTLGICKKPADVHYGSP